MEQIDVGNGKGFDEPTNDSLIVRAYQKRDFHVFENS